MNKRLLSLLFATLLTGSTLFAVNYDISETKQLVAFLNQPSAEQNKTNAEAIGITVEVTEFNIAQWEKKLSIYTKNIGGIEHITDISLENKGNFRLGGSFHLKKFSYLKCLYLYNMGNEVKVDSCPGLEKFRLMGKYGEEHCRERKLEITYCPKLWQFRIECLVTEFTLNDNQALEQVNISHTNFPSIDFSMQTKLEWLILNNNAFSEIKIPEAGKWRFECRFNRIEPADLMAIIRKFRGDDLYLDWRFPATEYTPQEAIVSIPVGTKIDLRPQGTFKYGNPEKSYTGTFTWQYNDGTKTVTIPANADMTKGVYTIPSNMVNRTIVASYECAPFFIDGRMQYTIHVTPKE